MTPDLFANVDANGNTGDERTPLPATLTPAEKIAQTLKNMAANAKAKREEVVAAAPLTLDDIAAGLGLGDMDDLGLAVWRLAMVCERCGNRGLDWHDFKQQPDAETLCLALLDTQYARAWNDILFHVTGQRRGDYSGWGVRRKPAPWWKAWFGRYGTISPAAREVIDERHAAALIENESRRVARKHEVWGGLILDEMETCAVAYAAAMLDVLAQRYRHKQGKPGSAGYMRMLAHIYDAGRAVFLGELRYRVQNTPQRPSKKKLEAARRDWYSAAGWIERGTEAFFSPAFIAQAVTDDAEPILSVDMDALPRLTRDEAPVRMQRDREVIETFLTDLLGATEGTFEHEDGQLILKTLRNMAAVAKGQKTGDVG